MKKSLLVFVILGVSFLSSVVHAQNLDKKVDFYKAYNDYPLVRRARISRELTFSMRKYLSNPRKSLGIKAALINALASQKKGFVGSMSYRAYLASKYKTSSKKLHLKRLNSHELFSLGYLMYIEGKNEKQANLVLREAARFNETSFTIAMVRALIKADTAVRSDLCEVYYYIYKVINSKKYKRDLKQKAIDIIVGYINPYKKYCSK